MAAETAVNGAALGRVKRKTPAKRKAPLRRAGVLKRPVAKTRTTAGKAAAEKLLRTSEILRGLMENNPGVKSFTLGKILDSLGTSSFGTSLMAFSIPEVLPIPVPGVSFLVVLPTGIISAQMALGKKEIRLPKWLLKRSVPRKALAAAIYGILPVLERLERGVKPRWKWMTSGPAKRFLGLFILLLSGLIALPIPGTNMPLAIAIFVTALGLVERDGLMIAGGLAIGLASMALLGGIFAALHAAVSPLFGA